MQKTNEELLFDIINCVDGSIYWKDLEGRYLGCNQYAANMVGLSSPDYIVGKTDYDLFSKDLADVYRKYDLDVIENQKVMSVEEKGYDHVNNREVIQLSLKRPLYKDGKIVGIIGNTINITDSKKAQFLEQQNLLQKQKIEEQERFKKIANQVAHDISSPLVTLGMMLDTDDFKELPHRPRDFLNDMISKIRGVANHLLSQYRIENGSTNNRVEILLHDLAQQVCSIKRYQYKRVKQINLEYTVDGVAMATFAKVNQTSFSCMLMNLIENAYQALADRKGNIKVNLRIEEEKYIVISVQDNGYGMPAEIKERLLNSDVNITAGKIEGHGIGFSQIRDTAKENGGVIRIESEPGFGTNISVLFPIVEAPIWFTNTINFKGNDIVVVLDDDSTVHDAWDMILEPVLENNQSIQVKHFVTDADTIDYIESLSIEDKERVFLLTDYELAYQEYNGLDVINKTKVKNSLLLTNHYADRKLQDLIIEFEAKMLPKSLASTVRVKVERSKNVQVICVDDDKQFIKSFVDFRLKDKVVDRYYNISSFLNQSFQYSKDVIILMDNYFSDTEEEGKNVAETLYKSGFKNLYLLSIDSFAKENLPTYLTPVCKSDQSGLNELTQYISTVH